MSDKADIVNDLLGPLTTTDGRPVHEVRAEQRDKTGMHASYIVMKPEERAKGFVRPLRRSYVHVHCKQTTTMGSALCETYARDPNFYHSTFCVSCNAHFPITEFVWSEDGDVVGS
jgi:hypothetical protein